MRLALQLLQPPHTPSKADGGGRSSPQSVRASWPHSRYERILQGALVQRCVCLVIFPGVNAVFQPRRRRRRLPHGQSHAQTASARCPDVACAYCLLVHSLQAAAALLLPTQAPTGPCGAWRFKPSSFAACNVSLMPSHRCQRCRHGGHLLHMMQWFETETHCPVYGCSCSCHSFDKSAALVCSKNASS